MDAGGWALQRGTFRATLTCVDPHLPSPSGTPTGSAAKAARPQEWITPLLRRDQSLKGSDMILVLSRHGSIKVDQNRGACCATGADGLVR